MPKRNALVVWVVFPVDPEGLLLSVAEIPFPEHDKPRILLVRVHGLSHPTRRSALFLQFSEAPFVKEFLPLVESLPRNAKVSAGQRYIRAVVFVPEKPLQAVFGLSGQAETHRHLPEADRMGQQVLTNDLRDKRGVIHIGKSLPEWGFAPNREVLPMYLIFSTIYGSSTPPDEKGLQRTIRQAPLA
jgi:hypothetical protein